MTNGHYILKGHTPVDVPLLEWAKWFEKSGKQRIVKQTMLKNGKWVSTVFLGLDHNFFGGKPYLFETMVFPSKTDYSELDCNRYSTWDEAAAGHLEMIKKWQ